MREVPQIERGNLEVRLNVWPPDALVYRREGSAEPEYHVAHRADRHVEHVAAVDVQLSAERVQFGEDALGCLDR